MTSYEVAFISGTSVGSLGPEPGDLVGLGVHVGLGQDGAVGVVHHGEQGEQVDLLLAVVASPPESRTASRTPPL